MEALTSSPRAPGLTVGSGVVLTPDVVLGANVVIHAGTVIGGGVEIQDGAVLGKPVKLGPRSSASRERPAPLVVEEGAVICAGAIVLAGAHIGRAAIVADQTHVRERAVIGAESVIGRGSQVDNDVTIGERVRIQSGCYVTSFSLIEDDVFVGPGVTMTNDHTMARHAPTERLRGPTLRRACRVGGAVVLLPGVEIGEEAFVAAGAIVTRDVPPGAVVRGGPARVVGEVPAADRIERWS